MLEEALGKALDELMAMEAREGEHLKEDLHGRVASLAGEVAAVESMSPEVVKHHRESLMKRVESMQMHCLGLRRSIGSD